MTEPILIFGAGGQVGQALCRAASAAGFEPVAFRSSDVDITDPSALRNVAERYSTAAVINAAAYTAVDAAETDAERAYAVNALAPAYVAAIFASRPIIHYSTDYVFPGDGDTPYTVDHDTNPLGAYGLSKRMGEVAILSAPSGTVLRTAWVYGPDGNNFLKTMIRVGRQRGALKVVDDQMGTPTHADDIAVASLAILRAQLDGNALAAPGLFHLTAKGQTSWFGFASAIFDALKEQTGETIDVTPIPSSEYPTPAKRPAYSVLDCSKIDQVPGVHRPEWQAPISQTVAAVLKSEGISS